MKLRLLKKFEKDSIAIGEIFEPLNEEFISIYDSEELGIRGSYIKIKHLITLGYVEEVIEKGLPKFLVWQKVVYKDNLSEIFTTVREIEMGWEVFFYNEMEEKYFRLPTDDEIARYYQ